MIEIVGSKRKRSKKEEEKKLWVEEEGEKASKVFLEQHQQKEWTIKEKVEKHKKER
jgi:hypothetical protein